jgi:ABC-type arginine/histidine transport system permease subunit
MAIRMQQRRGTAEQWELANPVLAAGEIGFETDTNQFKLGDGVNRWEDLAYFVNANGLGGSLDDYIPLEEKGAALGVATLDESGQVLSSQIGNTQVITPGLSQFVAISRNKNAYSSDGISWTESSISPDFLWSSVTYGSNKFVAISSQLSVSEGEPSSASAYSIDGIEWTISTLPAAANWSLITYGGDRFIAVSTNTAAYSTDGVSWTLSSVPSGYAWSAISYGNGKFVLLPSYDADTYSYSPQDFAAYSTDGISWSLADLPESAYWSSITYGDGKFVALAKTNEAQDASAAAYSTDGLTWSIITLPSGIYLELVAYGENKFVMVGEFDAAYSTDGIAWIASTMPSSEQWKSVTYGDGNFVAVGFEGTGPDLTSNKAAISTNGATWTQTDIVASNWSSVTYGSVEESIVQSPVASELYVNTAIENVVGLAPEDLDTLAELAAALGDNPEVITTLQSDVASLQSDKADTNSPTFTGLTDFEGIVDFSEAVVIGIETGPAESATPHPFSMIG